jgi:hypothetical protein
MATASIAVAGDGHFMAVKPRVLEPLTPISVQDLMELQSLIQSLLPSIVLTFHLFSLSFFIFSSCYQLSPLYP